MSKTVKIGITKNEIFKEGDVIALLCDKGVKPSKTVARVDELMPQLSYDELKQLHHWLTLDLLTDEETRHEVLSTMDVCPCCQRWLGNNNPPTDDDPPEPAKPQPRRRKLF